MDNRTLYIHDNLDILRGMNSESVDLIATDPPFNKGRDFHATPDSLTAGARFQDRWSWEQDVHPDWIDGIKDDQPALYELIDLVRTQKRDDLAAFLCWLGVRVIEMRRVLNPTGSLYLHCDPTASHYIKAMLDGIFGVKHFRNEIVWSYRKCRTRRASFSATTIRYFSTARRIAIHSTANTRSTPPVQSAHMREPRKSATTPTSRNGWRRFGIGGNTTTRWRKANCRPD